jgi:hypothetical protein
MKRKLVLFGGVLVGLFVSDYAIATFGIEERAGIGMDDVVRAAVIAACVLALDAVI